MSHLLHVDASARHAGSYSRALAATFRRTWEENHPEGTVTYRDLAANPVPHVTETLLAAAGTAPERRTPEQAGAVALRDGLVAELLAADAYVISAPMYNYSIGSGFKAWLDQVIVPGVTVGEGLPLGGRPMTVITSHGGGYGPGSPREGWNFVDGYVQKIFGEFFGLQLEHIVLELALSPVIPAMAALQPQFEENREQAHSAAAQSALAVLKRLAA